MLITANCQIQSERFSVKTFWKDINQSKATVFHYLGVMASLLIKIKIIKLKLIIILELELELALNLHYMLNLKKDLEYQ